MTMDNAVERVRSGVVSGVVRLGLALPARAIVVATALCYIGIGLTMAVRPTVATGVVSSVPADVRFLGWLFTVEGAVALAVGWAMPGGDPDA